jgi:flagellar protein FlgJ
MLIKPSQHKNIVIPLLIALAIMALVSFFSVANASPQQDFIDKMGPVAQEIVPGYGLWPSVFIAQAALESGWGTSILAVYANNYFGRKCLQLPCLEIKTPEYRYGMCRTEKHWFQMYPDLRAAVHGYCQQFFRVYEKSGARVYPELDASTPESQIRSVAHRYATDPRYAQKVLDIIDEWGLAVWDAK